MKNTLLYQVVDFTADIVAYLVWMLKHNFKRKQASIGENMAIVFFVIAILILFALFGNKLQPGSAIAKCFMPSLFLGFTGILINVTSKK